MRNAKSIIGNTVVGKSDGTHLGSVRDLIFDQDANRVAGLVLSDQDLFGIIEATVVPWREVEMVGKDVVLVSSADSRVKLRQDERLKELAQTRRDTMLSGTTLVTSEGQKIGTLADLVIDENTGDVSGYEVSGGFVSDSMHGKKLLPGSTDLSVGQDVAIVPPSAADELRKS